MPIIFITPQEFVIQQCSACGAVHSLPIATLELGIATDHNIIALPACACGALEFLTRTFDSAPDPLADHRKKVNALAVTLKSRGQIHSAMASKIRAEKTSPQQVGDLIGPVAPIHGLPDPVFPEGLILPE